MDKQRYTKKVYQRNKDLSVRLKGMKYTVDTVIDFYSKFDRYAHLTYVDLYQHISPSIRNGQYKIFFKDDNITGFTNWAFCSNSVLKRFLSNGKLYTMDWMSGFNLLYVDFVASEDAFDVMRWLKNHSTRMMGANRPIYWARSTPNRIKRITKQTTKEHWLWAE